MVHDRLLRKPERIIFSLNFKVATSSTLVLLIAGTVAFFFIEIRNTGNIWSLSLGSKLMVFFQSVTPRTAGFNTIDIGKMTTAGLFITIALMFIGASPAPAAALKRQQLITSCTRQF